jgi:hypothetical protein
METATKLELEKMLDSAQKQIDNIDKTSIYCLYYLRNAAKRSELIVYMENVKKELDYRYDYERNAASNILQKRDPLKFARRR